MIAEESYDGRHFCAEKRNDGSGIVSEDKI